MANYVFYESPARRRELARTKYRSYSSRGFETADEIFHRLSSRFPDLICVEENYGERVIMRQAFGPLAVATNEQNMDPELRPHEIAPLSSNDNLRLALRDTADALIAAVRQMGIDGAADGMLYGTRGTPELLGHMGHQWESWITKDIGRRCQFRGAVALPPDAVQRFHEIPAGTRGKDTQYCDIHCSIDGSIPLWIECKSIFECVILQDSLIYEGRSYARDYTGASASSNSKHTSVETSIREVLVDASKLECLQENPKHYLGLLILEFDREDRELSGRPDYRAAVAELERRGWQLIKEDHWPDPVSERARRGFQEHVRFYARASN